MEYFKVTMTRSTLFGPVLYQDNRERRPVCDSGSSRSNAGRGMWFVVVALIGLLRTVPAEDLEVPDGRIVISPSIVDLDTNISFYTVSCHIDSIGPGFDSTHLSIRMGDQIVESKVINETTIVARVNLRNTPPNNCGHQRYGCYWKSSGLDMQPVVVGRPPAAIAPTQFKCISEDQRYLRCEFPSQRLCDLASEYSLFARNALGGMTKCDELIVDGELLRFDSRENECLYLAGREKIEFKLDVRNDFGERSMQFLVNNFDVVRPAPVGLLKVINTTSTRAEVRWDMKRTLKYLGREFRYEIHLISEFGNDTTVFNNSLEVAFDHSLIDLYPYTEYKFGVRVQLVPKALRMFDEEYWSDWSSIAFRTDPCRPHQVPLTMPGTYSLKEIRDHLVALDVYWQHVPRYLQNGPGFEYNISAVSVSGDRYFPITTTDSSATFLVKMSHYKILLSCYNSEGPTSSPPSVLEVFLPQPYRQPQIKRVLKSDDLLELTWFPIANPEDLLSYTIMYCNPSATNICQNSIHFATLAPTQHSFSLHSNISLNFALAANYTGYSSQLSWNQCVVSLRDSFQVIAPRFHLTDVEQHACRVRIDSPCVESSFHQRYDVIARTTGGVLVFNGSLEPYRSGILVDGLASNTRYLVEVAAVDEFGGVQAASAMVETAQKANAYILALFTVCGVLILACLLAVAKFRITMDIRVENVMSLALKEGARGETSNAEENFKSVNSQQRMLVPSRRELDVERLLPIEYIRMVPGKRDSKIE